MESSRPRWRNPGITWRSLLLSAVLIPVNVFWVTIHEVRWYSLDGSCLPLFITPIFILFCLVLLNLVAHKLWKPLALSQGELLTTYILVVMSSTISGHDMMQNLLGSMSHPFWFATPENGWAERFFHYIPDWAAVRNKELLRGYYQGNSTLTGEVWAAWAVPLLVWGTLIVVLVAMMLCLNVIVRRQWAENERLTYPIVQLPLALTENFGTSLLRNRIFWYGFAIPAVIDLFCGMHAFFPAVPTVNVKLNNILTRGISGPPWSYMGRADISWYPFMIGLAYFLPLDLSFSCWFFYVVRLAMQIIAGLTGHPSGGSNPYLPEQGAGGWLALAFLAILGSKHYLREVIRQAFHGQKWPGEPMTYRAAVGGLLLGFVYLIWWSAKLKVGWVLAAVFWILYFLLSLAMTRVRAELGAPHEIFFVNPRRIMFTALGTGAFKPEELTFLSITYWFNRCYRCHPMPAQLEALKMAENDRMNSRRLVWAMLIASVLAIVVCSWANLWVCYNDGAAAKCIGFKQWVGAESYNDLSRWLEVQERPNPAGTTWMVVSAAFTFFCAFMRRQFLWWPFHPAGYPLAVSFALEYFWFAVFVAWALKGSVLRIGGMRLYRQGIPFALGLILGDYFFGSIWAIIGPAVGIANYRIFI